MRPLDGRHQCVSASVATPNRVAPSTQQYGNVLAYQGKLDEAIGAFRRARELNPENAGDSKQYRKRRYVTRAYRAKPSRLIGRPTEPTFAKLTTIWATLWKIRGRNEKRRVVIAGLPIQDGTARGPTEFGKRPDK